MQHLSVFSINIKKIGAYFILPDGNIGQKLQSVLGRDRYNVVSFYNSKALERVKGMIVVRNVLRQLIEAEKRDYATSLELEDLRKDNAQILKELEKIKEEPDYVFTWVPLTEIKSKELEKPQLQEVEINKQVDNKQKAISGDLCR